MKRRLVLLMAATTAVVWAGCESGGGGGGSGGGDKKPPDKAPDKKPGSKLDSQAKPPDGKPASSAATIAPVADGKKPDAALVERGRYLSDNVAGCPTCHTPLVKGELRPDMAKFMAGGLEIPEPWGTWRSPNITPDKKTGIGDWSDQELIDAIRLGKRKGGDQLYVIMPYMNFNMMPDDDVKAIVAYLRTVKPVENVVKGNTDLKIPKIPAPKASGAAIPADKQGEYLIALMGCVDCHTPVSKDFKPDFSKRFGGGMPWEVPPFMGSGTLYTANLTPDATGVGKKYDEAKWIAAITAGKRHDGTPIVGPMMFMTPAWAKMKPDDLKTAVKFLAGLPAIKNEVPKSNAKLNPPPGGGGGGPSGFGGGGKDKPPEPKPGGKLGPK